MISNNLTKKVTSHPVIIILIILILTGIFFYGLTGIEFLADVKEMLPGDDPSVTSFDQVDETFGGADYIMLALETENIFTHSILSTIDTITAKIEDLEGVSGVMSITNAGEIKGVEYGIEVIDLIDEIPVDREELEKLRIKVLSDENFAGNIVSKDGRIAAVVIQLLPDSDDKVLLTEIDRIINESQFLGKTYIMGIPVTEKYIRKAVASDMKMLIPFVMLVVIIVLLLTLRSFWGILLPLLVVIISTIWTIGLMGFLGVPLSNISNILPVVLIGVGTAYAIHILTHYQEELSIEPNYTGNVIIKTMSIVGVAILLAGITTMVGFSANIFSPLRPIKEMGLFTAFGIGIALLISTTLIPAVLSLLKKPGKTNEIPIKKDGLLGTLLEKLSAATCNFSWVVLAVAATFTIIALIYLPRLNPEFNLVGFYKPDSPPVKSLKLMEEKFGGADVIQVLVKGDIQDPQVLRSMEHFQNEIGEIENIRRPYSLVNILKDVNQALNEGDTDYHVLPSNKEEAAQFLLLLSIGGAESLDKIVSFDYNNALITARVASVSGQEKKDIINRIEDSIKKNFKDRNVEAVLTGMPILEQAINDLIVKGQLNSLIFAILFVFILMIIVTRSFSYGAICTIPIALTVIFNFGVMSIFKISLDVATAMIAAVAIGIGVDYSIHFFNRYKFEKQEGKTKKEAVQTATTSSTGKAIIYNALAVGLGFLVLAFSSFPPLCNFGWLIALTMIFSSVGALTVLPALLVLKDKKNPDKQT